MPVMSYLNTCIFDHGAIAQLAKTLKGRGVGRPFLVTDPGIKAAGLLDTVLAHFEGAPADIFDETEPNPTERQAREATERYKASSADGIVSLGGGSSMDLGKMVGLMASHDGPYEKYAAVSGGAKHIGKIPVLVAIPTTAGTGSEVSVGTVVILDNGRKETIVSPNLIPPVAICDPDLTVGLPAHLTAATGMDAVTHCIEAVLSPMVNPPAEGVGYDGATRAIRDGWLRRAVADGSDKEARWNMMMASYEGALAFVKGLGGVHALSHAAGRLHDKRLHHGTLNAIFLPHLLRENEGAAPEKYERLRFAMGLKDGADLGDAIERLNQDIGIPPSLSHLGLSSDDGPAIVEFALADLAHAGNAKPLEQGDYERIYLAALS
ncbi:MAG: iron-containing alcohol dehydrogenase [Pseudomonadota bacterium]